MLPREARLAGQQWVEALRRAADGADPLATWVGYIRWTQEAYPTGGKEAGLMQLHEVLDGLRVLRLGGASNGHGFGWS